MIRRHGAKFEAGGDKVLAAEQKKWVAADQGEVMSGCLAKRSILRNLQLWKCQFLKIFFSGGGKSVARQRAISVCLTSSVPTHFFFEGDTRSSVPTHCHLGRDGSYLSYSSFLHEFYQC